MKAGQIAFAAQRRGECQILAGRREAGINIFPIAPRIQLIPTTARQVDGVQAVETKAIANVVQAESLITEPGRNRVGP